MEEAFRIGGLAHILSGQKGVYPPLTTAWRQQGLPMLPVFAADAAGRAALLAGAD